MATPKPKKVVSQDQLRRLMREKQFSAKTAAPRVDHPLAKYNSLNQLMCTVCSLVIKSDNLWTAHIQSKQHKEKYLASKTQGPAKPADLLALKRKITEADAQLLAKKVKVSSEEFNGSASGSSRGSSANNVSVLAGYSSSSSSEDEDEEEEVAKKKPATSAASSSSSETTGPDFFDAGFKPEGNKVETESKPTAMADVLPEGFFDDPKMDAKVRQVEYKDKMDEEWELFQKSMKEETHVSEAIIEEEDEQLNVERNLDEIDDQIQRWKEVDDLHVKKETIAKTAGDGSKYDSDADLEEEDLDQFLDWRSKKSWK